MKNLPAELTDSDIPGGDFSTKLRGEDALCYREPCAFPLTGATVGAPEPQRVHLKAYECTFSPCNREEVTGVYRHTKLFSLFRAFGISERLLRTEVSHFLSTLLSPVDRGSERCVRCPQAPVLLPFPPWLNELKGSQK